MIKGAANASAVGTLVECTSPVVKLLQSKASSPPNVRQGFTNQLRSIERPVAKRGYNENMNGLPHQYLPKETYLSVNSQKLLDAIADQINNRPR